MTKTKSKKILKWILISVLILLILIFGVVLPAVSISIYRSYLDVCFITDEHHMFSVDAFDGLTVENVEFPAKQGHMLAGYKYRMEDLENPHGVVVFSHGLFSGGQNRYMPIVAYFAEQGFEVFAYDATGNDASGGLVGGVSRGVMDLDYAIRYVKQDSDYTDMPICLYGYSWGAYSVGTVLNFHPDVKAVAIFAGFNKPSLLIRQMGYEVVGGLIDIAMPYVNLYERIKFGEHAAATTLGGFKKADQTQIFVVHSTNDPVVEFQYGYQLYHDTYGDDPRFRFVQYEDRGHDYLLFSADAMSYREEIDAGYDIYLAENGLERNNASRAAYRRDCIDDSRYFEMDITVMDQVTKMFISACEN